MNAVPLWMVQMDEVLDGCWMATMSQQGCCISKQMVERCFGLESWAVRCFTVGYLTVSKLPLQNRCSFYLTISCHGLKGSTVPAAVKTLSSRQCIIPCCKKYHGIFLPSVWGESSWCGHHHPIMTSVLLRPFEASLKGRSVRVGGSILNLQIATLGGNFGILHRDPGRTYPWTHKFNGWDIKDALLC